MGIYVLCAILAIPGAFLLFLYRGEKRAERLRAAIQTDDIPAIRELVTRWPSLLRPRTRGSEAGSPLHTAAWEQRIEIVRLLLELGADVNAKDDVGNTPLHRAVSEQFHDQHLEKTSEIVELLIASGASVHAGSKFDWTPLHYAASGEAARILLQHGADPNATHDRGESPMHRAAGELRVEVTEALAQHGGDINLRDNDGLTPLQHAVHHHLLRWDREAESKIETLIRLGADTSLLDRKALDYQIEFWERKRVDLDPLAIEWIRSHSVR